jgi:hypothetical protein
MINRLHAMYQQSSRMLIFLILIFSAVTIANIVITIIICSRFSELGKLEIWMKGLTVPG